MPDGRHHWRACGSLPPPNMPAFFLPQLAAKPMLLVVAHDLCLVLKTLPEAVPIGIADTTKMK